MTLIDQIRDLIAEGETERSLDELYKYVKESNADVIDNLVMLRSRMQSLQRSVNNGTMDHQAATLERAKINESILKLLPQLTPEYLAKASNRREQMQYAPPPTAAAPGASAPGKKKIYMIAGGAVVVLIVIMMALSNGGDDSGDTSYDQQQLTSDMMATNAAEPAVENSMAQTSALQEAAPTEPAQDHSAKWSSTDGTVNFVTTDGNAWQMMDKYGNAVSGFRLVAKTDSYVMLAFQTDEGVTSIMLTDSQYMTKSEGSENWYEEDTGSWAQ